MERGQSNLESKAEYRDSKEIGSYQSLRDKDWY